MWDQRQLILDSDRLARAFRTLDEVVHVEVSKGASMSLLNLHPMIGSLIVGWSGREMLHTMECLYKAVVTFPAFLAHTLGTQGAVHFSDLGRTSFAVEYGLALLMIDPRNNVIFQPNVDAQLYKEMRFWLAALEFGEVGLAGLAKAAG